MIPLWHELESCNPTSIKITDKIDCLLFLIVILVSQLVQIELKLATVDSRRSALLIDSCQCWNVWLSVLVIGRAWDLNGLRHAVLYELPNLAAVGTGADHKVTSITKLHIVDLLTMFMLYATVLLEKCFI